MIRVMKRRAGFTLIELMVTVAIMSIVASLAVPSMMKTIPRVKLRSSTNQLANDLQLARLKGISGNFRSRIVFDTVNHTYTRFLDTNRDGAFVAGEADISNRTLATGITFVGGGATAPNVTFDPVGTADDGTGNPGDIPIKLVAGLDPPEFRDITINRAMGVIKSN